MVLRSIKRVVEKKRSTLVNKNQNGSNVITVLKEVLDQKFGVLGGVFENMSWDYDTKSKTLTLYTGNKVLANELNLDGPRLEAVFNKKGLTGTKIVAR